MFSGHSKFRPGILVLNLVLFLPVLLFAVPVYADPGMGATVTPWTEDEDDIQPRKISLADLQDLQDPALDKDFAPSPLEALYSSRIVDELEQYGYDLFSTKPSDDADRTALPAGAVQDSYVLSAGDKIDLIIRGQQNVRQTYTVDNQGFLITHDFPPVTAAGRSVGDVRKDLESRAAELHNTEIFVSLSGVRQISVLIVGHVNQPGRQNLTVFHSVLDALSYAGGVQKTGSLRQIKLVRSGISHPIDLYQLLTASGGSADKLLQDGDRIIVPPIGATMAVSGAVKRAGIYELRAGEKLSLLQALGIAGGVLTPGNNRFVKFETTGGGEETVTDIDTPNDRLFGDGTILMVAQAQQKRSQEVNLQGHTRQPGSHDLKKARTLSELIKDEKVLGADIYPLIGIIERRDAGQLTKKLLEFSPRMVLTHEYDTALNEGDVVHLFSMQQIRNLELKRDVAEAPLLQEVSMQLHKPAKDETSIGDPLISSFLLERSAFVRGAVRQPGAWPVAMGATLDGILAVAGGPTVEASTDNIEVTSRVESDGYAGKMRSAVNLSEDNPMDIFIHPGDTIRVNQKFNRVEEQSVMVLGEVLNPGRYDLMPGDTMMKLIERAGGLTMQAYPDGAIFSRASERKQEENRFRALAQDLELKLAATMQMADKDEKPDMTQINATQGLIKQLKHAQAVGRITVEADPATLQADPEQDILLESGDKVYIPRRPLTVRVGGEVLSPASLQFRKGKDPDDYIREAGGTTYYADKDRAFVIYPDGSAEPVGISSWQHSATFIPPGSTIIVPRDPKPFDFLDTAERISGVLANLAISGLYIEAIGDD